MLDLLVAFMYSVYSGFMNGGGAKAEDLMIKGAESGDSNMLFVIDWMWQYLSLFAVGMTTIYFLYEINQKMAFEAQDATMKSWIICFAKLAIAYAILVHVPDICGYTLGAYNDIIETASSEFEVDTEKTINEDETKDKIKVRISSMGLIEMLGFSPIMLLLCLLEWVLSFIWSYKAFVYRFEVLWKIGVTPIAFADIYSGNNSQAIRWIKSLVGTVIYGAAFFLIVKLGHSIMSGEMQNSLEQWMLGAETDADIKTGGANFILTFKTCIKMLVVPFAELGALGAIKQVTKEAFG